MDAKKYFREKVLDIERILSFSSDNSLLREGGVLLFYAYLYKATSDKLYYDKVKNIVESEIPKISERRIALDFGEGITGFLWMLLHCKNEELIALPDNFIEPELETMIQKFSEQNLEKGFFDYLYGGLGGCVFCFEQSNLKANEYFRNVINLLENISEKIAEKYYWKGTLFSKNDEINFGLAHGIPSIITIISKIYSLRIVQKECLKILNGAVSYLLSNKSDYSSLSLFPSIKKQGINETTSRLGWCYGDLGIASALWQAGKSINNEEWKEEAVKIMLHASKRRELIFNKIFDAGLCHGTTGVAIIFYRFFKETGNNKFCETAFFWFNETLKMAKFEDGLAGFKSWKGNPDNKFINDIDFLEGVTGIGLALITAAYDIEPNWDRCLLLSSFERNKINNNNPYKIANSQELN